MKEPHLPVLSGKLIPLMGGGIVPRTKTCINWGGPIAMLPHFHQGKAYTKMNLQVWRVQKCIPLVGAETQLTCAGQQTTPSHGGGIWPRMETWVNWGGTYRHGTMFAPKIYLYPKEATVIERTEMYCPSQCRNTTSLCGPANYPVSRGLI